VTFLNLPLTPEKVHKQKAWLFYCSPFAILLENLMKISSAVLEISRSKMKKKKKLRLTNVSWALLATLSYAHAKHLNKYVYSHEKR